MALPQICAKTRAEAGLSGVAHAALAQKGRGVLSFFSAPAESGVLSKLQPHETDSEVLTALLPQSGATAELCVPLQWPAKGVALELKNISTEDDRADAVQAMALLQGRPELAYSSIAALLQAVDEAVLSILAPI